MSGLEASVLSSALGKKVRDVKFVQLDDEIRSVAGRDGIQVWEADLKIQLIFEGGGSLDVSWGTPGNDEGLVINYGSSKLDDDANLIVYSLAGATDPMPPPVLGGMVSGLDIVTAQFDWAGHVAPWALLVSIGQGDGISVALGSLDQGAVGYSPDSLVLITDEAIGRGYMINGAHGPAWWAGPRRV